MTATATLYELNLYVENDRDDENFECDYNVIVCVDKAEVENYSVEQLLNYLKDHISSDTYEELEQTLTGEIVECVSNESFDDELTFTDGLYEVQINENYSFTN